MNCCTIYISAKPIDESYDSDNILWNNGNIVPSAVLKKGHHMQLWSQTEKTASDNEPAGMVF